MSPASRLKRAIAVTVAAAAAAVSITTTAPAPTAAAATSNRYLNGWLPYWTGETAEQRVLANGDLIGISSPFWYYTDATGAIKKKSSDAGDATLTAAMTAKGMKVVPSITDGGSATETLALLSNSTARKKQIAAIVDLAVTKKFHGIDMDYEKFAFISSSKRPAMRKAYSTFMAELGTALHAKGKILTVAVMSKTSEHTTSPTYAWDYAALGRSTDRVRLMTYDYGWSGGAPNPVAPLPWVKSVVSYTKKLVPASKIQMGIPLYGYNWGKTGATASAVTHPQAVALMAKYKAARHWNSTNAAPYFGYKDANGVTHIVHYMDKYAVSARIIAAKSLGINGVTFWAFGQEDPGMWQAARDVIVAPVLANTTAWGPATVVSGQSSTLTVNTPSGYAGRTVAIQRYYNSKWTTVATKTLNASGDTTYRFTTGAPGTFKARAVIAATYYKPTVLTNQSTLTVTPSTIASSLKWSAATVTTGSASTLMINTPTAYAGRTAVIQRYTGTAWANVATVTLDKYGNRTWKYTTTSAGTFKARAQITASGSKPAMLTTVATLTVQAPAPAPAAVVALSGVTSWSPATVTKGSTASLVVNTPTANAGRTLTVQQYTGGKWVTISGTLTLNAYGNTKWAYKPAAAGTVQVRVAIKGTATKPAAYSTSSTLTVK